MPFLEHVYYWASEGCPDAVPAGIIAVDLGLNEADHNDSEIKEIRNDLCDLGIFDDMGWCLGFGEDTIDLIRKLDGDAAYLTAGQIVADWQWAVIKQQPGLRFYEVDLDVLVAELEQCIDEDD